MTDGDGISTDGNGRRRAMPRPVRGAWIGAGPATGSRSCLPGLACDESGVATSVSLLPVDGPTLVLPVSSLGVEMIGVGGTARGLLYISFGTIACISSAVSSSMVPTAVACGCSGVGRKR